MENVTVGNVVESVAPVAAPAAPVTEVVSVEPVVAAQAAAPVVVPSKKRGRPVSTQALKRVVLLNGKPVGKGRPAAEGNKERTAVYIPINEVYDVAKHGVGIKFNPKLKQFSTSIKRVSLAKLEKLAASSSK